MMPQLLMAYYGDDFTGSTDVMEALSRAGLRTVLFLRPPTAGQLADFPGLRAFGIAGGARTLSPLEMDLELPAALEALKASGAPMIHYKICSTFDSSPLVGSIGRAIEIGRRVFGDRPTPLVVGAPVLGRYVVFGNLFARSGLDSELFRLDRHPTMSRHPVTPMKEADIQRILADQTSLPVHRVDVLQLDSMGAAARDDGWESPPWPTAGIPSTPGQTPSGTSGESSAPILIFDTLREEHLSTIGRELARMARDTTLFVVGSSGIEYALVAHWRQLAQAASEPGSKGGDPSVPSMTTTHPSDGTHAVAVQPVEQLLCVSGSCSPVTDRQISRAVDAGFREIPIHARHLIRDNYEDAIRCSVLLESSRLLSGSRGLILHTSRGPADPRMLRGQRTLALASARLGPGIAQLLEELLMTTGIRRAVVCGGDTSMAVARHLGIVALEYLAPIAPGCPLCRVHAPGRIAHGCEIAFKGGQVGRDSFFLDALGTGSRSG